MPEGKGYGAQDTASIGPSLKYIGGFVYGYSGAVPATNDAAPITLVEFTSGAHILEIHLQFVDENNATYQRTVACDINGVTIIDNRYDGTPEALLNDYRVIVPPFSNVVFGGNINGATSNMYGTVTGRVYGQIKK